MTNWNTSDGSNWNKQVIEEFRANGGKVGRLYAQLMLLTTTGRKSGKPYTVPVGYLADGDRFILVAGSPTRDWYLNLLAHPQVQVEVGKETFTATATPAEGEQKKYFLQQIRKLVEEQLAAGRTEMAQVPGDDAPIVVLQREKSH